MKKKAEEQIMGELAKLRQKISELEKAGAKHKKTEKDLKVWMDLYKDLVEKAGIAILIDDLEGNFIYFNRTFANLFGYTMKEMKMQAIHSLVHPDDVERVMKFHRGRLKGRKVPSRYEFRGLSKDGSTIYLEVDAVLLKQNENNIGTRSYVWNITHRKLVEGELEEYRHNLEKLVDKRTSKLKKVNEKLRREIIERKQAEEDLRESEEWQRSIFEGSRDTIFIAREDASFVDVNEAASALSGYSKKELKKMKIQDLHDAQDQKAFKEYFKRILEGESITSEAKIRKKNGTKIDTEFSNKRILIAGKYYMHSTARDITERKKAEDKIAASLMEKEVLLKEIHYRVKNNMQIISSLLRLQSVDFKSKKMKEVFKESQNRIRSMALIHEKLYQSEDFSKIIFAHYIQGLVVHLFHSYRVDPNIVKLKVNVDNIFLDINTAIPCGLIINEIVSNSLKHAFPEGKEGEVVVKLRKDKHGKFALVVKDNGVGFPEDIDFQNPKTLGLQIVNDLIKQLEGTIVFDRKGGTGFKIVF